MVHATGVREDDPESRRMASRTPNKIDMIGREALNREKKSMINIMNTNGSCCMNEHDVWAGSLAASHGVPHPNHGPASLQDGVSSCYRCPMLGEPVTITGMGRRTDLNGARGEIVDPNADDRGRITVRIFNDSSNADRGAKRMKVDLRKLVPVRKGLPQLTSKRPPLPDECSSAYSMSRVGSVATSSTRARGRSQPLGSRGYKPAESPIEEEPCLEEVPQPLLPELSPTKGLKKSESAPALGRHNPRVNARMNSILDRALKGAI